MDPTPETRSTGAEMQGLLDHTLWVRDLARKLVRDPHLADDLAQEAVLAALEEPRPPRSMRAWLGTVLRNLVWERLRSDARRRRRESNLPDRDPSPSTLDLVERMASHRMVVETVMSLPEHYREVLLHRYFEGETPTGIAGTLDVPLSTVKTRLARGLAMMRERLDRQHGGDGKRWLAALAPVLRVPRGAAVATGPAVPATLVPWAAVAGVAGVGLVGWLAWSFVTREAPAELEVAHAPAPASSPTGPEAPGAPAAGASGVRRPLEGGTGADERALAALRVARAPTEGLRGRVLDLDGAPVAGVLVRISPYARGGGDEGSPRTGAGASVAISDEDGAFDLRGHGRGRVEALSEDLVTLLAGETGVRDADGGYTVVVAPRVAIAGRVVDELGRPLEGAEVVLLPPAELRSRFDIALERASEVRFRTTSDADGRFALPDAPRIPDARLEVTLEGRAPHSAPPPGHPGEVTVVLPRPVPAEGALAGRVVDAQGRAVADARVSAGRIAVRTDEAGLFHLDLTGADPHGEPYSRLMAMKGGHGPAALEADPSGASRWPPFVELALGEAPLSIRGRVVDGRGRPSRRILVWLGDATVFTDESLPTDPSIWSRRFANEPSPLVLPEVVESYLRGEEEPWTYVETALDGSFELAGLFDREYELVALDPGSLVRTRRAAVPAGAQDVLLTLDTNDVVPRVAGHVVDRDGNPVAGVAVTLVADACKVGNSVRSLVVDQKTRVAMLTGKDGEFWVNDVPRSGVHLLFEGRHVLPVRLGGEEPSAIRGEELRVVVPRLARVRVIIDDPAEADRLAVLDREGLPLALHRRQGAKRLFAADAALVEGRSEVLGVADSAATVVLYRGAEEVRRTAIGPGEVSRDVRTLRP